MPCYTWIVTLTFTWIGGVAIVASRLTMKSNANAIDVNGEEASHLGQKTSSSVETALVQRIVATPSFTRSALLTNFLLYICNCKAEGRDEEITEYQIGVQALGRHGSYNPSEDNIVRNYARILRKRLEEYFAGEGSNEPLRIVIPLGHYVPVFEPNLSVSGEVSAEIEVPDSVNQSSFDSVSGTAKRRPWYTARWFLISVVLFLVVCAATSVYWASRTRSIPVNDVFWKEMFDRNRTTYVVPGDSGFAMLQDITGKEMHLNDYISGNLEEKFSNFNLAASRKGAGFGPDRFSNYTSTADLSISVKVASLAQLYNGQLKVRYARDMHMEDLKSTNVVLIGAPHANPWVEIFEPQSNFYMRFPMHLDGMHIDERSFINKHPRPNEQTTYANQAGDTSHLTYALISFLPGADGSDHVLILEGQNMAGTRAAGDFLLDRHAIEPVLKKALLSNGSVGPFEILIETRTVGANAPEAHVVVERYGMTKASK